MLPAAAQGAVGIEIRCNDEEMRHLLAPINCASTTLRINAERAFLLALDGSCQTPLAALATIDRNGGLTLKALAARPDGTEIIHMSRSGAAQEAEALGRSLGEDMKRRLPPDFFTCAA
jgi:hydroxymethylbilane synthase